VNRVERWKLFGRRQSLTRSHHHRQYPVAQYHDGGRIRFGSDGMLYVGTGDARIGDLPERQQSVSKILRLTPDGQVPKDNPFPGKPAYILGIRNIQGFD